MSEILSNIYFYATMCIGAIRIFFSVDNIRNAIIILFVAVILSKFFKSSAMRMMEEEIYDPDSEWDDFFD